MILFLRDIPKWIGDGEKGAFGAKRWERPPNGLQRGAVYRSAIRSQPNIFVTNKTLRGFLFAADFGLCSLWRAGELEVELSFGSIEFRELDFCTVKNGVGEMNFDSCFFNAVFFHDSDVHEDSFEHLENVRLKGGIRFDIGDRRSREGDSAWWFYTGGTRVEKSSFMFIGLMLPILLIIAFF